MKKVSVLLLFFLGILSLFLIAATEGKGKLSSCYGPSCRGLNPQSTSCRLNAYTVYGGIRPSGRWGRILVELRYSGTCVSNWSRVSVLQIQQDSQGHYGWPDYLLARAYEHGCNNGQCWYTQTKTYHKDPYVHYGIAIWTKMVNGQVTVTACGGMKDSAAPWSVWYSPWGCYSG